jgi:hypothetical protein
MASDRDAEGLRIGPRKRKTSEVEFRGFSSKRSTFGNGCCVNSDFIRVTRVANKSEKDLSLPLHITHASFGSIR